MAEGAADACLSSSGIVRILESTCVVEYECGGPSDSSTVTLKGYVENAGGMTDTSVLGNLMFHKDSGC